MISYFIPFFILATLTYLENIDKYKKFIYNNYFYLLIFIFLTLFIGFRYEVGCDWEGYNYYYDRISSYNLNQIIENYQKLPDLIFLLVAKLVSFNFNYYFLNLVFAILFTSPLFIFSRQIKRTYFSLMIAYPYYLIVIGMSNIRQAVCLSFLLLSIDFLSRKKNNFYFFSTIFSFLTHHSSIIANGFIFLCIDYKNNKKRSFIKYLFFFILLLISIFNFPIILNKLRVYFSLYSTVINPAKSALLIWIINFIPVLIFLINESKFKFNNNLKRIFLSFSIYEILMLPLLFINSVVAYRLILYSFPISIYIISYLPDMNIYKVQGKFLVNLFIIISFLSLLVWLNFAYHSHCYLPYKNILFNK